ncbi:MAG: beta-ketoacyl synthase N-terminal-like domain-containing protein, partial [Pseudomonadota bacterium]
MSAKPTDVPAAAAMTPLQRAFLALEDTRARLAAVEAAAREPIAIIGIGCRVPGGGDDPQSFWRLLRDGKDAITPLPADRWDVEATSHTDVDVPGRIATRAGGFLREIDRFDPEFFGITRREAQGMDPQQRLLLEVSWEALENAGQPPDGLERSVTGVYMGLCGNDYAYLQMITGDRKLLDAHFASGIGHSIASGRLSYLLGLQGPSLSIDTACSSSLVAVHLACQALRTKDCRMALAGGVNLILGPEIYIALSQSRMLAPDGRCKTFDAAADGFARGEGCGVVVLKRLSDAIADGDRVLAVVRGSAVNQDGASSGLTAPNGPAQEAVIRDALSRAGVVPGDVGYIEAHGTGTQLGDPLEATALGAVFGPHRDAATPLWVGSVKTNIGHLEAAAGVTGLIKLVLSLQHRTIPAHLNFSTPSPHIPWGELPLRVPTRSEPWQPIAGRRIGGISSFGFSGTNVHIVLEEASPAGRPTQLHDPRQQLLILSAHQPTALAATARKLAATCRDLPEEALGDLCFSAAATRAQLPQRAVVVARSMSELAARLEILGDARSGDGIATGRANRGDPPRIAFLFTGQGAQYAGMARGLYETQPVFRAALDRCACVLDELLETPLREMLSAGPEGGARLDRTANTQPVLFAVEFALTELWRSWGVQPDFVIGHSVGEYVAATVAGVFTLEDGLRLIAERGRLMQTLPQGGAMAAVFADEKAVSAAMPAYGNRVSIAALNGPAQTVISGSASEVDSLCATFTAAGVRCQRLPVSHAFHSSLVEPVLDDFERAVAAVKLRPPQLRLISNLTGRLAEPDAVTQPGYWRRHLREAVRWADGMRTLAALRPDICVEIGPHATLLAFAQEAFDATPAAVTPALVATLRKGRPDAEQINEALGQLYLRGARIDWRAVWSAFPHRQIDLPTYAFQRERTWFGKSTTTPAQLPGRATGHPLLGVRLRSALTEIVQFETRLDIQTLPFLRDHRVQGRCILPATALMEMGFAAARELFGEARCLRDLVIAAPLVVDEDESRIVQIVVRQPQTGDASIEVLSCDSLTDAQWSRHLQARFDPSPAMTARTESAETIARRCTEPVSAQEHRAQLSTRGLVFGPSLHGVQRILRCDGEALGEIELPDISISGAGDYVFHPALLDACVQVLNAAVSASAAGRAYLPLAIDSVRIVRSAGSVLRSHARLSGSEPGRSDMLRGDITVFDDEGVVALLSGIVLRATDVQVKAVPRVPVTAPFYRTRWQPAVAQEVPWLPTVAELGAHAGPMLPGLLQEHDVDAYQRAFLELEVMSADWICDSLQQLGWHPAPGERLTTQSLHSRLGIVPRYERLLGRFLEILAEDGYLQREDRGEGWRVQASLPPPGLPVDIAAVCRRHPSSGPRFMLANNCGPLLASLLRGTVDPLHLLFPEGSAELAESLYRDSPEAKAYNQLIREAVLSVVKRLPAGRRLRVLEVGGGTGGTTSWVAAALPADRTQYLFTDIGPSMVIRARERFGSLGFMEFQSLDLEHEPAGQGLQGQQFDLILASNVIHATSDLCATFGRLKGLLTPGGSLLMLEVGALERWIDVTFGLTDGWWRFSDTGLRRSYPLLSRDGWLELLQQLGFETAAIGAVDPRSREVLLAARRPVDEPQRLPVRGSWLILADAGGVAEALAGKLEAAGQRATLVRQRPDAALTQDDAARDALDAAALQALLEAQGPDLCGVLHLCGLDAQEPERDSPASPAQMQRPVLASLLYVAQALGSRSYGAGSTPRVLIATRGAQAVAPGDLVQPAQAPVWGVGKVLMLEHPELRAAMVDLDPAATAMRQGEALLDLLKNPDPEQLLALRGDVRFVARLERFEPPCASAPCPPVRLEKSSTGVFDDLQLKQIARQAPAAGEIEIEVRAAGLNFRDVMNAVAMRDDPEPLGGECAGRVSAVGEGVEDFVVGDHVVALAEACFASHANAHVRQVAAIPGGMSFAAAVTLPFAFMTAHYALNVLGGLRAGETVLIHAGAGGVGCAAIQLAKLAGARIIATAGSEQKRDFLRSLGVQHVMNSRTLEFEQEIATLTGGQGVDVVLNSLAGDFIPASVRSLAAMGRFLEIGKRDIWTLQQFLALRPQGQYHAIDLAAQRIHAPQQSAALFTHIMQRAEHGELQPLPFRAFDLASAADAFRFMAQARHIGKVVLCPQGGEGAGLDQLDPHASYLVTGGLTGLGLLTAAQLVNNGARRLVLAGRRAASDHALAVIA